VASAKYQSMASAINNENINRNNGENISVKEKRKM
jgi:hypothetical protein